MITYRHDGLQPFRITVKNGRQIAGHIKRDETGYYYTARTTLRGESFATVDAVKASLEGSNECGQCEGTGTTDAMGEEEECPVCSGTGRLARDIG